MNIQLYYYAQCPFCMKVLMAIKSMGLTKVELKNTLEDRENYKFHVETTGRSTVPCLYVDGKPMFESDTIVEWLRNHQDKLK